MRRKVTLAIAALLAIGALAVVLLVRNDDSGAPVHLTLRVGVEPAGQSEFAVLRANSAKFKYLVGNMAGVKPVFAQKLSLKPLPDGSGLLEAHVGADTQDQARRYAEAFVQTLQRECGDRARLTVKEQTIR